MDATNPGRPAVILYCEGNTDGTIGGSHYCLLHLLENLDRSRFTPIVLFYDEHALISRFRDLAEVIVWEPGTPVRWTASSLPRALGWLAAPIGVARRAANVARYLGQAARHFSFLRRRRVDLLHLNNSVTSQQDWMMAAFAARVPCVVHQRGMPEYRWYDRKLAQRLALIVPVSHWVSNHLVEHAVSRDNIRVMYDGLDPATMPEGEPEAAVRAAWNIAPDQQVIGIVGNVREWKGQEIVVRALIEVVRTQPQLVCFFVGASTPDDRAYMEKLERLIADAGIQNNVRFTGFQNDVASFVRTMEFVVHASTAPEPFGMVILEAMALRKAVVASRAGGAVEIVKEGETGYTFPLSDWRALADIMLTLLTHPDRARQMGERGYQRLIDVFGMPQFMRDMEGAYQTILTRGGAPAATLAVHGTDSSID